MKKILVVIVLAICPLSVSAQTQVSAHKDTFGRLAEGLTQINTGTLMHQTQVLVRDRVDYVRIDGCQIHYRRTAELISPARASASWQGRSRGRVSTLSRAEFEIEEWRFSLAEIDLQSIKIVKPWTSKVGQRLYLEFGTASGEKLISSKDYREPYRRKIDKVATGRLTLHDDATQAEQIAGEMKRAVEMCRRKE